MSIAPPEVRHKTDLSSFSDYLICTSMDNYKELIHED